MNERRESSDASVATGAISWADDFGDVVAEHGALTSSVGLVPRVDRLVGRVEGERAAEMIGGLVTNEVAKLPVDRAVYAFLLSPKGRPIADLRVIRLRDLLWLDLPAAAGPDVAAHFTRYLPPRLARFSVMEDRILVSVIGPRAAEVVERLARSAAGPGDLPRLASLEPLEVAALPLGAASGGRVLRRESTEGPGFDLYLPADAGAEWTAVQAAASAAGGRAVGRTAYDIWRVERALPAWGAEISPDVLPQETGLEARAISLTKGCYTGQEVVARIHYRGHVNRHLRSLRFPRGAAPPAPGQRLYHGDREVGYVTSSALSPSYGPIALGYVRREVQLGEALSTAPGAPPAVLLADRFTSQ